MAEHTIIGMGYVGLPLALLTALKGNKTIGLDIDTNKVEMLNKAHSYIGDVSDESLSVANIDFTSDASKSSNSDVVFICVPTPVTKDKRPDLTPVISAVRSVLPHIKQHTLIVLESTVNPGVCDEVIIPILEERSDLKIGESIYLAHCPERINPGDPNWTLKDINRVVGANSSKELSIAVELYESLLDAHVKPMATLKEAEACKIVENCFRAVNIAFVNELAQSFAKLGINIDNVINGAATKPFAFMPHFPGCGVGGHCIPVDPYYLIEYASNHGFEHQLLRKALETNEHMPTYTIELLEEALGTLSGSNVALLGLSYKSNIGDDRESPAYEIRDIMTERGANLAVYDPYIKKGSTVDSLDEALQFADAIIIATAHRDFTETLSPTVLHNSGIKVVIDGRNALKNIKDEIESLGIHYRGIGI